MTLATEADNNYISKVLFRSLINAHWLIFIAEYSFFLIMHLHCN